MNREIVKLKFVWGVRKSTFGLLLVMVVLFTAGCNSTTKRFTDIQTVNPSAVKQRPVVITMNNITDNRKSYYYNGGLAVALIPLFPYGITRYQSSGPPENWLKDMPRPAFYMTPDESKKIFSLREEQKVLWQNIDAVMGPYEIQDLLLAYLKRSKLTSDIFLGEKPYTADLMINITLDKYERRNLISFYGLTGIGFIFTFFSVTAGQVGIDYNFTFEASDINSNQVILKRTYEKSVSTPLYLICGAYRKDSMNAYDIAGPSIHEACKDFATELDKVLPPPSDKAYWDGVIKTRNERIAAAEAKKNPVAEILKSVLIPSPQTVQANISVADPSMPNTLYALVIGNDEYKSLPKLTTAVSDAEDVAKTLGDDYGFKVTLLKNATRAQTLTALYEYRKLGNNDGLLIYYAGHGWLDTKADEGYWLPVDATQNNNVDWIQNASITAEARACPAKHILIVADSCYSGKLVRGLQVVEKSSDYFQKLSDKKARMVMSSGGLEPVADASGKDKHSVFASAFLDALKANNSTVDGLSLFGKVRERVGWNADQIPEYGVIHKSGHDGGDFIFIRKSSK